MATATAVPVLGPHDPPQIIDISLAPTTIGSGDTVVASATTSSNVASVEARVQNLPNGMQLAANMEKVGVGKFAMHYAIPSLPWYAHGNYTVLVIARNVDGASATRTVSITVR